MNGYKRALLGLNGLGTGISAYFVAKPSLKYPRDRMTGSLISGVLTTFLIWKA